MTTITLLKEYRDTNYEAMVNINHAAAGWSSSTSACVSTKNKNNFLAQIYFGTSNTTGINSWHTVGYIS